MTFKVDFILRNNQSCFRKYLIYYSKLVYDYINREEAIKAWKEKNEKEKHDE